MDVTFAMQHEVRNKKKGLKAEKNGWWRRGSNSRGIAPIGNQEILKSDALDQLGHATDNKICLRMHSLSEQRNQASLAVVMSAMSAFVTCNISERICRPFYPFLR